MAGLYEVSVVDLETDRVVDTIDVPGNPSEVAVNRKTNTVYVASDISCSPDCWPRGHLSMIDGSSNEIVSTIRVGLSPSSVAVNPRTNRVFVANYNSENISVVDGAKNKVMSVVDPQLGYPTDLAVNPRTNRLYVTGGEVMTVLDMSDQSIVWKGGWVSADGPQVAVGVVENRVYVTDGFGTGKKLRVLDASSHRVIRSIPLSGEAVDVAVNPRSNLIHVGTLPDFFSEDPGELVTVDAASLEIVGRTPAGGSPWYVSVNSKTYRAYASDDLADTVWVITEDSISPESSISHSSGIPLEMEDSIRGTTTDDFSGVKSVTLSFEGPGGSGSAEAVLRCDDTWHRRCSWEASPPLPSTPGPYLVQITALDRAGNLESEGPTIVMIRGPGAGTVTGTVAGAGQMTPTCDGKAATKVGTSGDDVLRGTRRRDVIVGLGGDDVIKTSRDSDTICGNGGADHLFGGKGRDNVFGGAGRDRVEEKFVGEGKSLDGGDGRDVVSYVTSYSVDVSLRSGSARIGCPNLCTDENDADSEADLVHRFEIVFGSRYGDELAGDNQRNLLRGMGGGDSLRGDDNDDRVFGGDGRDWLYGGDGTDHLFGGTGLDRCRNGKRHSCER